MFKESVAKLNPSEGILICVYMRSQKMTNKGVFFGPDKSFVAQLGTFSARILAFYLYFSNTKYIKMGWRASETMLNVETLFCLLMPKL